MIVRALVLAALVLVVAPATAHAANPLRTAVARYALALGQLKRSEETYVHGYKGSRRMARAWVHLEVRTVDAWAGGIEYDTLSLIDVEVRARICPSGELVIYDGWTGEMDCPDWSRVGDASVHRRWARASKR